jgi:hypothetical protein
MYQLSLAADAREWPIAANRIGGGSDGAWDE